MSLGYETMVGTGGKVSDPAAAEAVSDASGRTAVPPDARVLRTATDPGRSVAAFPCSDPETIMSPDPRDEKRQLWAEAVAHIQRIEARGVTVDPANPTANMLASEKRTFERRVAAFREAEARAPKPTTAADIFAALSERGL